MNTDVNERGVVSGTRGQTTEEVDMSSVEASTADASPAPAVASDLKLEAVVIPVSDVDRAKAFYEGLGWRLDADFPFDNGFRVVQLTPPGSPASVQFGANITSAEPGSAQGLYLIVSDIAAARDELAARGVEISEVFHPGEPGAQFQADGAGRLAGRAADNASYGSFATFSDPDGNAWLLQEITTRLPGRTWVGDVGALAERLHETSERHGAFEAVAPPHDWWDWYAAYMDARESGATPDEASAAADRYMAEVKHVAPSA